MTMNINAEKITRVLIALILVIFGLNKFFNFLPMPPMPLAAQGFMGALIETGYLMLLVAIMSFALSHRQSKYACYVRGVSGVGQGLC